MFLFIVIRNVISGLISTAIVSSRTSTRMLWLYSLTVWMREEQPLRRLSIWLTEKNLLVRVSQNRSSHTLAHSRVSHANTILHTNTHTQYAHFEPIPILAQFVNQPFYYSMATSHGIRTHFGIIFAFENNVHLVLLRPSDKNKPQNQNKITPLNSNGKWEDSIKKAVVCRMGSGV